MVDVQTTERERVVWAQQTVRGDVAEPTPFGTAAPEADYEWVLKDTHVRRIPQWIPAERGQLADQGELQGLIENQLATGVRLGLENEVANGDGTGEHLQGIFNATGIGHVTMGDAGHADEYELDVIHRAITTIRIAMQGMAEPTAVGLYPTTFEKLILRKDNQGRYIYPVGQETGTIWGLQPIVSTLWTPDNALVGDYRLGYRLWLREGLNVSVSSEHLDFFIRGMVALLAETRAAGAVVQPLAFCEVEGL
jgi:HK97 family phage major capsid protein